MQHLPYLFHPLVKQAAVYSTSIAGWELGTASSGYQTLADAGVEDGERVAFWIRAGSDFYCGVGTYTASGDTLTDLTEIEANFSPTDTYAATLTQGPIAGRDGQRIVIVEHTQSIPDDTDTQIDFSLTASHWIDSDSIIRTDLPGTDCGFYYGYGGNLLRIHLEISWESVAGGTTRTITHFDGRTVSITSDFTTDTQRVVDTDWMLLTTVQLEYPWFTVSAYQDSGGAVDVSVRVVIELDWGLEKYNA